MDLNNNYNYGVIENQVRQLDSRSDVFEGFNDFIHALNLAESDLREFQVQQVTHMVEGGRVDANSGTDYAPETPLLSRTAVDLTNRIVEGSEYDGCLRSAFDLVALGDLPGAWSLLNSLMVNKEVFDQLTVRDQALVYLLVGSIFCDHKNGSKVDLEKARACLVTIASSHEMFSCLSKRNQAKVLFLLGFIFYYGYDEKGTGSDWGKAKNYLEVAISNDEAARKDHAQALILLGFIFYYGAYGVGTDLKKTCEYLEMAMSNNGFSELSNKSQAMVYVCLGRIFYFGGSGVSANWKKSSAYLEEAITNEDGFSKLSKEHQARSFAFLGFIFYYGYNDVGINWIKARKYLIEVVSSGSLFSEISEKYQARVHYCLGISFAHGIVMDDRNPERAKVHLCSAASSDGFFKLPPQERRSVQEYLNRWLLEEGTIAEPSQSAPKRQKKIRG